jgi:hypothetical protein
MTGAADVCAAADNVHYIVGSQTNRFVHHKDARDGIFNILTFHFIPPLY